MSSTDNNDPMRNAPMVVVPLTANKSATRLQVLATAAGAVLIVTLVLYGINSQRSENGGADQTAATEITPATPQNAANQNQPPQNNQQQQIGQPQTGGNGDAPATTGQGGGDQNSALQSANDTQNSSQPPTGSGQSGGPPENNGQTAPPRGQ